MARKINISLIYTQADRDAMLKISQHLTSFQSEHDIALWNSDPIYQAELWQPQDAAIIHEADIFLLLVSDHFMHSEFINQLEFKLIIDRFKDQSATVLAVILDPCEWNIEFKSDDYDFKISELEVLPANAPLSTWTDMAQGYKELCLGIQKIIDPQSLVSPLTDKITQREASGKDEPKEQLAIDFVEEVPDGETADTSWDEKDTQKEAIAFEQNSTAKEVSKIRAKPEPSEASSKTVEALQEQTVENPIAATVFSNKDSKADDVFSAVEKESTPEHETGNNSGYPLKGKVLWGALIGVLLLLLVWVFSVSKDGKEQPITDSVQEAVKVIDKDQPLPEKKVTSATQKALPPLKPGDSFEGGIVFAISQDGKTGIIAHPEDAGKMTWNTAIKIDEQLGAGWRLPTLEELQQMFRKIGPGANNSGEFSRGLYWSATEFDQYQARLLRFSDGNTSYHYNKELPNRAYQVRAVRNFVR